MPTHLLAALGGRPRLVLAAAAATGCRHHLGSQLQGGKRQVGDLKLILLRNDRTTLPCHVKQGSCKNGMQGSCRSQAGAGAGGMGSQAGTCTQPAAPHLHLQPAIPH